LQISVASAATKHIPRRVISFALLVSTG